MKKTGKKVLALLLAGMMVLAFFAGCARQGTTPSASAGAAGNAGASGGAAPKETYTLTVATYKQDWVDALNKIFEIYKSENPQIEEISLYVAEANVFYDDMKTMLASDTLPNMMRMRGDNFARNWKEHLADISDSKAVSVTPDQFKDPLKFDGKYYGVYFNYEMHGQVYNKNYLEQVGVTEVPKTKSELTDLCEKLKAAGLPGGVANFKCTSEWTGHMGMIPFGYSGDVAKHYEDLTSGAVDPLADEGWNLYYDWFDMMKAYCQPNVLQMDSSTGRMALFADEYSFAAHDGSWLQNISAEFNPEFRNYALLGPYTISDDPEKNHLGVVAQADVVTTAGGEAVTEQAKKFFDFYVCDDRVTDILVKEAGAIVTRNNYEISADIIGPLNAQGYEWVSSGKRVAVNGYHAPDELNSEWRAITQKYVGGEMSREEALKATGELFRSYNGK